MKSQVALWQVVTQEMGDRCRTSTTQDIKTALGRFEHEGLSFFTITLSNFCADFQKSLDRGYVGHDLFRSFSFAGGLPRFLGGFLDLVFVRASGLLRDEPSPDAIYAIRQITLLMSKVSLPCSDARVRSAFNGYITCEKELKTIDSEWTSDDLAKFSRVSRLIFGDLFNEWEHRVRQLDLTPKHGPGATADRIRGNAKFADYTWTARLENVLPFGEFKLPNWRYRDELNSVKFLEPGAELPVRVISVPKTLKTPRIIAIEPTCMQYAQQALLDGFLNSYEKSFSYGFLGFKDQLPNRELARKGSLDGTLATLDLSEASDRVSNQLVRQMLGPYSFLREAVDASRSRKADVPGHGVIRLTKFASMGSALTFPIEALVFLTCVFIGIEDELNSPLNRKVINSFRSRVRVFGDDIIVPVEYVQSVVQTLHRYGAKVNTDKSFWDGDFRESCGGDYYAGHDVTVVRQRALIPSRREHVRDVIATVALRNNFYKKGLRTTCQWLDEKIARVLPHFPVVHPDSPVLGRHNDDFYQVDTMCPDLHRPLVRGYVVKVRLPRSDLDGVPALVKVFLNQGDEPLAIDHLERAGRPVAVDIKLRWSTPY